MASTAIYSTQRGGNNPNGVGGRENNNSGGIGAVQRNLWGNPVVAAEAVGLPTYGGNGAGIIRANSNGGGRARSNIPDNQRGSGLSGAEDDEIEEPVTKRAKGVTVSDETVEVPAAFYGQVVGMLETFGTKTTVYFDGPESEKKKDRTAFVLWKGRTRPDGTMTLSIMDDNRTVREVVATEVSIAQQFKNIFDGGSASRIFELVGNGQNIQKAVFQTLREQDEAEATASD
jgi:hypothetical protein